MTVADGFNDTSNYEASVVLRVDIVAYDPASRKYSERLTVVYKWVETRQDGVYTAEAFRNGASFLKKTATQE